MVYEAYFIFAFMWAVGGSVSDDKVTNHRKSWSSYLKGIAKVKFPDAGAAEDYRFEAASKEWVHWENWVRPYDPIQGIEVMYQNITISSMDLRRRVH